ncbi:MAG: PQQ-binding-like beta-propeller repeat protein, partial [Lentisphaeria bacterium]|nr:PQQ-binding-like beta-propeller repeat protein [Lentisphaeria bacterium]
NGRELWSREMPSVGRFPAKYRGGGIAADRDSLYAVVGAECARLAADTGEVVHTYPAPPELLGMPIVENPILTALDVGGNKARPTPNTVGWEFLAVTDDLVLGSVGQPNFAWTGWPEAHPECCAVFALGKARGERRWTYTAAESVSPNAICVRGDRLYLIDQAGRATVERAKLRGRTVAPNAVLKAMDLASGQTLWETREKLDGHLLWMGADVLLVTLGKTSAYAASDGRLLWSRKQPGHPYPVIVGDTVYLGSGACDLHTGEPRRRIDPLTGAEIPWRLSYKGGCGSFSGCPSALFCRSGATGLIDLAGDSGMTWLGQVRPSCWVNMIAAGGMLLVPEGASSCSCPYNYQTSLAMVADRRHEEWFVFPEPGTPPGSRIRTLAVNIGAPGDKRDEQGALWAAFPRPFKPGALTIPLFTRNVPTYYRRNADETEIGGTGRPWLYTSGIEGALQAEIELFFDQPAPVPECGAAPAIDGRLEEPCWGTQHRLLLTDDNQGTDGSAVAWLRHNDESLFVGFRREAARKDNQPVPWRSVTSGPDSRPWDDDSFGIRLWDAGRRTGVYLHLSNTGATFDGRTDPTMYGLIGSDPGWNGPWSRAVQTDPEHWTAEIAVPWTTLAEAGIRRDELSVYLESVNHTGVGPERLQYRYRTLRRLYLFSRLTPVTYRPPPAPAPRLYDVVLHFAEVAAVAPGERRFDVKLQGETVLANLDVAREAGGRNRALVRTVKGVRATERLALDLVPRTELPPILSGIELRYDETTARELARAEAGDGLVAHWRLDAGTGTRAPDSGPFGLHGTIEGAEVLPGPGGGGLRFDGQDDTVDCGTDARLNIPDALTVSAWIKVESHHEDQLHDVVLSKGADAYSIYLHRKDGGRLCAYVRIGPEHRSLAIHMPEFGHWHHIAMTVRDGEQKTYYDGTLQATSAYTGTIGATDTPLILGYHPAFPVAGHFDGSIEDVRIHRAVLSPEAIGYLHGEGRGSMHPHPAARP